MGDTWITDLTHFLDEHGSFPANIPGPALNLALFLASIVAWVTSHPPDEYDETNVTCRRSPSRKRCLGTIVARLDDGEAVEWGCPVCGDNGVIRGWESTPWDRRDG
ncbi:MAG TPA: hypothetical protein VGK32_17340 [Vicinamibacterales bacterium]|jgi:hypothetical protein